MNLEVRSGKVKYLYFVSSVCLDHETLVEITLEISYLSQAKHISPQTSKTIHS